MKKNFNKNSLLSKVGSLHLWDLFKHNQLMFMGAIPSFLLVSKLVSDLFTYTSDLYFVSQLFKNWVMNVYESGEPGGFLYLQKRVQWIIIAQAWVPIFMPLFFCLVISHRTLSKDYLHRRIQFISDNKIITAFKFIFFYLSASGFLNFLLFYCYEFNFSNEYKLIAIYLIQFPIFCFMVHSGFFGYKIQGRTQSTSNNKI